MPLIFAFYFLSSVFQQNDCGGIYRWDNKILIDPAGLKLFKKKASLTSMNALVNMQKPLPNQLGFKRPAAENKKITITAWITDLGMEDDHDYHLVLQSLDRKVSMIGEVPDPSCDKLVHFPGLRDKYQKARAFVDSAIQQPTGQIVPVNTPVKVRITGIVFFDKTGHGNGHADNSIEIHPILEIRKTK
jgi:hypothetical protein